MKIFQALVAAWLAVHEANAKAAFAHFMIGNTGTYTISDFVYDMQVAQQAAIDGFALNMAYNEPQNDHSIPLAFQAATQVPGFKLFFSFDYAGNGAWPADTVRTMIQTWAPHGSYFRHSTGQPLVSTFEGRENAGDWHDIKAATGAFFIPDWSSIGARKAVALSNGVADGLFNWGAWPNGAETTNWDLDASYLIFLEQGGKPTYMAPISPWFYTNMPGYNKNWLWQGGLLWYQRWERLAALSILGQDQWPNQPEYIQIISWNDYGESHYIGPLNDKAYLAFDKDKGNPPFNYVLGHPHDGWRHMLPYMISMWKTGTGVVTQEVVTAWYRLTPGSACNSGGTTGNNADQAQTETSPETLSPDRVYVAALLTRLGNVRVTVGGKVFNMLWDSVPSYSTTERVGVYYGSVDIKGATGAVKVEIWESGQGTVGTLNGESIKSTCPNTVVNWNAWVGSGTLSRSVSPASPRINLKQQQCIEGNGSKGQFNELCQYSCTLGYCPAGPCTCYSMGNNTFTDIPTKNVDGYPVPGQDCTYTGLCAFACNHGFCPSGTCTTDSSAKGKCVIPAPAPDPDEPSNETACTSGTAPGNLMGLCDFSCGRGYCPQGPCTCTGRGRKINPPEATSGGGIGASGMGQEYNGLCNFACSRGYCPSGACEQLPAGGMFIERASAGSDGKCNVPEKEAWRCESIGCSVAGNSLKSNKERWDAAFGKSFFDYTVSWFGNYNEFNPNPYNGQQPFDGIANGKYKNHPMEAIAFFFSQRLDGGFSGNDTSTIDLPLKCDLIGPNGSSCSQSVKCGTTRYPAMDLMLKSWSNINKFYTAWYNSIADTQSQINAEITDIADTFLRKKDKNLEVFKQVLDSFSAILGVGSSTIIKFKGPLENIAGAVDAFSGVYDVVVGAIEKGIVEQADGVKDLNSATALFFDGSRSLIDKVLKSIFNGNFSNWRKSYDHFKDGIWIEPSSQSQYDFYTQLAPAVRAFAIVKTWKMDKPLAVIYEEGVNEGQPKPAQSHSQYLMSVDAKPVRVIIPKSGSQPAYTLWLVQQQDCLSPFISGCFAGAIIPTGADELAKGNRFNVTVEDIARSSFYGFMRNGKKNPYNMDKDGKGMDASSHGPYAFSEGLQTPGLFDIPVCTSTQYVDTVYQLQPDKCDTWPCC